MKSAGLAGQVQSQPRVMHSTEHAEKHPQRDCWSSSPPHSARNAQETRLELSSAASAYALRLAALVVAAHLGDAAAA
jgi:hypothetical protein